MIFPSLKEHTFKSDELGFANRPQGAAKTFMLQIRCPARCSPRSAIDIVHGG